MSRSRCAPYVCVDLFSVTFRFNVALGLFLTRTSIQCSNVELFLALLGATFPCANHGTHTHNPNTHTRAHARTHTRSCGSYNFDSHTAERMACPNVSVCVDGPSGISDTIGFAWNEGDVETAPGNYDIPLWVLLPKRAESTNLLVVASPSASHIGMST